jgi:hypothetical protein
MIAIAILIAYSTVMNFKNSIQVRTILEPSCICDEERDDAAKNLFSTARISIIRNLHKFSVDSDEQAAHNAIEAADDSESQDVDIMIAITDIGRPSVWNKKILDMENLATSLAEKYFMTFG